MPGTDQIIRNIAGKLGVAHIAEALSAQLSGSELSSLLLEVFSRKARQLTPAALLQQYRQNRFVHPADTDMIGLLEKELEVLRLFRSHRFESIELSPVAPFGACAVVAKVDQKKVLSALRSTEVLADATNSIALHIADLKQSGRWRPQQPTDQLRYSTVHRHVRAQPLKDKRFSPHFRIGCLVSSGRDNGNYQFECAALAEHFETWHAVLKELFGIEKIRFTLQPREGFTTKIFDSLKAATPFNISIDHHSTPNSYYQCVQFKTVIELHRQEIEIADGGFVDWTQQLLGNKKERLLISGFGLSLIWQMQLLA